MKLVHLYLALSCAFFFSLSQYASAQDAEKKDASTEDSAGGDTAAGGAGDAAPAEGGGEGGAAPAAGGESTQQLLPLLVKVLRLHLLLVVNLRLLQLPLLQ